MSSKDEDFLDLSVDVENNTSITHCLRGFSSTETLRSEHKYYCEVCCSKQEAQKRYRMYSITTSSPFIAMPPRRCNCVVCAVNSRREQLCNFLFYPWRFRILTLNKGNPPIEFSSLWGRGCKRKVSLRTHPGKR